jgi:hypothetical protein
VGLLALWTVGCEATLLHDLDEGEANDVVVLLAGAGVEAQKVADGAARYRVDVDRGAVAMAWPVVRAAGHPRHVEPADPGRLVVGPTEAAARARSEQALALEGLLRATPGVADARVVLAADGRVAAVARVEEGAAADLPDRLRGLLAAGAGADAARVALEIHALAAVPTAPTPPRPDRSFLLAVGAVVASLTALCAALLHRVRRLRRQVAS